MYPQSCFLPGCGTRRSRAHTPHISRATSPITRGLRMSFGESSPSASPGRFLLAPDESVGGGWMSDRCRGFPCGLGAGGGSTGGGMRRRPSAGGPC